MSKIALNGFVLLLLLLLGNSSGNYAAQSKQKTSDAPNGTLQRMIVENGSVTMELDLNRLNGISSVASVEADVSPAKSSYLQPARLPLQELHFTAAANSFFTILVFNDLLRGPEQGSITLVPAAGVNYPVVAGIGDAGVTAPRLQFTAFGN